MHLRILSLCLAAAGLATLPASAAQMNQTLQGHALRLSGLVANVDVKLDPAAQGITIAADGLDEMVSLLRTRQEGDAATLEMGRYRHERMDLSKTGLRVTVTMAPGTALSIDGFVGTMLGGDINAPLSVNATVGTLAFGRVRDVSVEGNGAADVTLGDVDGRISINNSGAGDFKAGNARDTSIVLPGAGNIDIASVQGALDIRLSGAGDIDIGRADGPVSIALSGVGDVDIRSGTANPLQISATGIGNVSFNGTGVNPAIAATGMGDVCIARVEGPMNLNGSNVTVNAACS